jgi:hypothetical protein
MAKNLQAAMEKLKTVAKDELISGDDDVFDEHAEAAE